MPAIHQLLIDAAEYEPADSTDDYHDCVDQAVLFAAKAHRLSGADARRKAIAKAVSWLMDAYDRAED